MRTEREQSPAPLPGLRSIGVVGDLHFIPDLFREGVLSGPIQVSKYFLANS